MRCENESVDPCPGVHGRPCFVCGDPKHPSWSVEQWGYPPPGWICDNTECAALGLFDAHGRVSQVGAVSEPASEGQSSPSKEAQR